MAKFEAAEFSRVNIVDCLRRFARSQPDHPAMEDGDRSISYAELDARTDAAAAQIRAAGIAAGETVTVILRDSIEHLIVLCGLARSGAVMFSLRPNLPSAEIQPTMVDAGSKVLVTEGNAIQLADVTVLDKAEVCAANGQGFGEPGSRGDQPFVLVQSSGTTGKPKSFVLSHAISSIRNGLFTHYLEMKRHDRFVCVTSMCFHICRIYIFLLLAGGATVVLARDRSPAGLVKLVKEKDISFLSLVPINLMALIDYAGEGELLFPNLRRLNCGTAPITPQQRKLARTRLSQSFIEQFGMNEVSVFTYSGPDDQDRYPESVGRPIDEVDVQIVDTDDQILPTGSAGMLRVRSPGMVDGYLNDPAMNARHFRDGWFYPGDVAKVNDDGYLFFLGRADDIINNAGTKFYPIEVESVLLTHPAVIEAAVFPLQHERTGQLAGAAVVTDRDVSHRELIEYCTPRMAGYKLPVAIIIAKKLPRTPLGKVDKRHLAEQLQDWLRKQAEKASEGSE